MKPMNDAFESLFRMAIEPQAIEPEQKDELRKIFFAGVLFALTIKGSKLAAVKTELREFRQRMMH
jgi:hypothetical protein